MNDYRQNIKKCTKTKNITLNENDEQTNKDFILTHHNIIS